MKDLVFDSFPTKEMNEFLKKWELNSLLPSALPRGTKTVTSKLHDVPADTLPPEKNRVLTPEREPPQGLRPLDVETIVTSVKKTNRLVNVEEGWAFAGIGAELAAVMMEHAFDWLDAPVARVAGADVPMPYAANLEKLAVPQVQNLVDAAKAVTYR